MLAWLFARSDDIRTPPIFLTFACLLSLTLGYYLVKRTFYWGEQSDSYENSSFEPKVIVGLASSQDRNNYDLGGANTNLCAGDTFMNWTKGVGKSASNTLRNFFSTFGILVAAIIAIFVAGWYITQQAKRKPKEVFDDDDLDENEYHKIAMVGNNRNLVDF
jgi:putative Mn2+ efflux pump MntP